MQTFDLNALVRENAYPGRGIVLGLVPSGKTAVIAYFIMGRSVNSRNRVFVEQGDGIRTQAFDPAKLSDPSLVIYAPVRVLANKTIVTNGDQTDTIFMYLKEGKSFKKALKTRKFEPDAPNYTPRISGLVKQKDGDFTYKLSILKSCDGNPDAPQSFFFDYTPVNGLGHFIHTYKCDGSPRIPSFEGEPKPVKIEGDIDAFTNDIWQSLNEDNKVSLFTRFINLKTGRTETRIVNKNQ